MSELSPYSNKSILNRSKRKHNEKENERINVRKSFLFEENRLQKVLDKAIFKKSSKLDLSNMKI